MTPRVATRAERAPIQALPTLLVNQIAAGEVVERPASVVKELVDNAIDAGASRITVRLEEGGLELTQVVDDGVGVEPDQLPLAVAPHATSKLREAADLDAIATMGFRGEALASIASVSRLTIRSRAREHDAGAELHVEGDQVGPVRPASSAPGTTVSVRNLFFNTPARRKFLRTPATEKQRCTEVVKSLAMAHPRLAFVVEADGRTTIDLPPNQSPQDRVAAVLGAELRDSLLTVSADEFDDARGVTLWGLIGLPEIARANNRAQRFFVNGRPIQDRSVQHALQEGYRGLIEPSRRPVAALMLEMDPRAVDVNVHPAKAEVRFRDPSLIHQVVLRAVRDALAGADLTPGARAFGPRADTPFGSGLGSTGVDSSPAPTIHAGEFVDRFRQAEPSFAQAQMPGASSGAHPIETPSASQPASPTIPLPAPTRAERLLQVHDSYLVTQDEQGMLIIDQHALHERVMFERIMTRLGRGPLESQRLLAPIVVESSADRLGALETLAPLLERIGVEAAALGPDQLGVHAFPTLLYERGVAPGEFVAELLDRAAAGDLGGGVGSAHEQAGQAEEAALHEVVDMMACKAAVKAGERLSESELAELMAMREQVERSSSCPHGRPTSVRLTLRDLERAFQRT